jgi:hypothetical protein
MHNLKTERRNHKSKQMTMALDTYCWINKGAIELLEKKTIFLTPNYFCLIICIKILSKKQIFFTENQANLMD